MSNLTKNRIESIDILRGLVMIIMVLDHVRDFFHITANTADPLDLSTTTPALFFTRWITHFCAPIFVFLSGTSIYLQSLRKTKAELSSFLFKRGLWFIVIEVTVVSLAITYNPFYNLIIFQVIGAVGICMVVMSVLTRFSFQVMLALGLVIVLGHNLLDSIESAPGFVGNFWWDIAHRDSIYPYYGQTHIVMLKYPFVPWLGVMLLGYCTGTFFSAQYSSTQRRKILLWTGLGVILFFVVLRFLNIYGDSIQWSVQKNAVFTLLSFLKVQKYPPSLLYICMTIGPALVFLSLIEPIKNRLTSIIIVYGRTAFFYYLLHFYLVHLLATITFFARGHSMQDAIDSAPTLPLLFLIPGEGFSLLVVYLIWASVVVALYPVCKWYDRYKTTHPEKWWLSYL